MKLELKKGLRWQLLLVIAASVFIAWIAVEWYKPTHTGKPEVTFLGYRQLSARERQSINFPLPETSYMARIRVENKTGGTIAYKRDTGGGVVAIIVSESGYILLGGEERIAGKEGLLEQGESLEFEVMAMYRNRMEGGEFRYGYFEREPRPGWFRSLSWNTRQWLENKDVMPNAGKEIKFKVPPMNAESITNKVVLVRK